MIKRGNKESKIGRDFICFLSLVKNGIYIKMSLLPYVEFS